MVRRPPRSTRTGTLLPYTTLFRSAKAWIARRLALDTKGDPALAEAQALLRKWDWNLDGKGKGDALALMVLRPANGSHYQRRPDPDPRPVLSETVNHLTQYFAGLDPNLGTVRRLRHGARSDERRGGKDDVCTYRVRGSPIHIK